MSLLHRSVEAGTSSRRMDIQGLRALAVLSVMAFHAGLPVPGGFIGVDIFFVISGFVITKMLHAEWLATGRIRFGTFYIRRFKRLIPALAVLVTFTVAASVLVLSPLGQLQIAAKTAAGSMFFIANAVIARTTGGYFDLPAESNPLLNIWSLSVEEQFYVVFPFALALGWFFSKRFPLFPALIVGCIAALSFSLAMLGASHLSVSWLLGFYSPLTRAWEFALGAFLVVYAPHLKIASRNLATLIGLLGVIFVGASLWLISRTTPFPSLWTLLPVAGTALLIAAGTHQSNYISRALTVAPIVRIGDWSYSIYLWHWPFIVMGTLIWPTASSAAITACALSLVPAVASYSLVEQPIRNSRGFSASRFATLVTITIALPLLSAVGSWQAARTLFWTQSPETMRAIMTMPTGWGNPLCISRIPVNKRDTTQCQWKIDAQGVPLYLVGDSNAMHFSEALRNSSLALDRPATALGTDGCPLIDVFLWRKSDPSLMMECRESYSAMMDWLTKRPHGLVMIGSVDRYWRDVDDYRVTVDGNYADADPKGNVDALNAGLERTVTRLQRSGHTVVLLQTIPPFIFGPYAMGAKCNGLSAFEGSCKLALTMPVKIADQWQVASRVGILHVAAKTGATVLDFRDYFCPAGKCSTNINGIIHYMYDGYHLNRIGSARLTQTFIDAITARSQRPSAGGRP